MRIISLIVAFCFSLNVIASTGTIQELEKHIDDYQYVLSVEWDQKDQAVYEAQTKLFFEKMNNVIANGNLTQKEIVSMIESKLKNKEALEALKLKVTVLSKNATAEELANIIKESANEMYSKGASWNGEVIFSVALGVALIGALVYSIWWSANHECVAYENREVCGQVNDSCFYTGGPIGAYHYDRWGNWVQEGYTCYGPSQTVCSYQNVCSEYARK